MDLGEVFKTFDGLPTRPDADVFAYTPRVFICAPYYGDIDSYLNRVQKYCWQAIRECCVPVVPYFMYSFVVSSYEPDASDLEYIFAKIVLTGCEQLWLFDDRITQNMVEEIQVAAEWKIPIVYKEMVYEGSM